MARQLSQDISKTADLVGYPGMQWLAPTKSVTRKKNCGPITRSWEFTDKCEEIKLTCVI